MTGRAHALDLVPGLDALSLAQHGVVRRDQLAALGVTPGHVRAQLSAQRWSAVGPHVLVLSTGVPTRRQQVAICLVHVGDGAVLGGRTVLERDGLRGWEHDLVHVHVHPERRPRRLDGLVAHRTTTLDPDHVRGTGIATRTTTARAAVDAACWEHSARSATGLVTAVVQQRLARPHELIGILEALPRARHRTELLRALEDSASGAESRAEAEVARLARRAGLGVPRKQVRIQTPSGLRRVDLLVELPDGRMLVIEVDGPHHLDPLVRADDAVRDAELIALGYLVLRIPVTALRQDPGAVLASLRGLSHPGFR